MNNWLDYPCGCTSVRTGIEYDDGGRAHDVWEIVATCDEHRIYTPEQWADAVGIR